MPSPEFNSLKTTTNNFDGEALVLNNESALKNQFNSTKLVPHPQNPFPRSLWGVVMIVEVSVYGCYPLFVKLSKVDNEIRYSTASLVLLIECVKLFFSLGNIYPLWQKGLVEKQPLIVWLAFSVPAILYCFNNNVAILVQQYIDPASYMIISNLKIPTTALLYRLIIKRPLTWLKWFAVVLLTTAGISNSLGNLVSDENLKDHANDVHVTLTGLSIMAIYCTVSAFAGIWTELIVKKQYEVSIHQQNCMMYTFGVVFNLVAFLTTGTISSKSSSEGIPINVFWKLKDLFHDFNTWVIVLLCSEVCGGLIMSAVMKHASNITRLFITSAAMVVTTLLSYALFSFQLNIYLIGSLGLVIVALFLYNRN